MKLANVSARWVVALVVTATACGPGDGTARAAERAEQPSDRAGLQELPDGVTPQMVSRGEQIFRGAGFCYTCHGQDGRGVAQLGADLGDDEWTHADGSYEGIVERIRVGVTAEASSVGVPMPPRGGGRLSDEQVRAVAAFVWVLSRSGT